VGDPCQPTSEERQATRALCRAIVKSVEEDERMPLPIRIRAKITSAIPTVDVFERGDVEDLVMQLAQEVLALHAELTRESDMRDRLLRQMPED
jgi:hypothetical protein